MSGASRSEPIEGELRCPCCGAPIDNAQRMLVDLDSNQVIFGGRRWRVQPTLAEFLYALAGAYPKALSYEQLGGALWGINSDDPAVVRRRLACYASAARRTLVGSGAWVEASYSYGFRLVTGLVGKQMNLRRANFKRLARAKNVTA